MKIIVLTILKNADAESFGPPPKFQVKIEIQLIQPVFPDYISISYNYG